MSAPSAAAPRQIPWRALGIAAIVVIVAAMALDASWRSDKAPRVTARPKFDPAAYGAKTYPKVVAAIDKRVVPVTELAPAIQDDPDAAGFITFNQFVNQVDYADAATALNNQVKAKVLKGLGDLEGKRVSFTGAFTFLAPSVVTVTPIRLQETG